MTELTMTDARAISAGATYATCPVCGYKSKLGWLTVLIKGKRAAVAYEQMWLEARHWNGNRSKSVHK